MDGVWRMKKIPSERSIKGEGERLLLYWNLLMGTRGGYQADLDRWKAWRWSEDEARRKFACDPMTHTQRKMMRNRMNSVKFRWLTVKSAATVNKLFSNPILTNPVVWENFPFIIGQCRPVKLLVCTTYVIELPLLNYTDVSFLFSRWSISKHPATLLFSCGRLGSFIWFV